MSRSLRKTMWRLLIEMSTHLTGDPAMPHPSVCPREMTSPRHENTYTRTVSSSSFAIVTTETNTQMAGCACGGALRGRRKERAPVSAAMQTDPRASC